MIQIHVCFLYYALLNIYSKIHCRLTELLVTQTFQIMNQNRRLCLLMFQKITGEQMVGGLYFFLQITSFCFTWLSCCLYRLPLSFYYLEKAIVISFHRWILPNWSMLQGHNSPAAPHVLYNGDLKIAQQTEKSKKKKKTLFSTTFAVCKMLQVFFSMTHCV